MKTTRHERLLAAALLGSVLGAAGCASTTTQSDSTMPPGASAEKASCKGQHGCNGQERGRRDGVSARGSEPLAAA